MIIRPVYSERISTIRKVRVHCPRLHGSQTQCWDKGLDLTPQDVHVKHCLSVYQGEGALVTL